MKTNRWNNPTLLGAGALLVALGGALYVGRTPDAPAVENAPEVVAGLHAPVAPPVAAPAGGAALPVVKVWKSPTCGCCSGWVEHMRAAGFVVEVEDLEDLAAIKHTYGVAAELQSCHTSLVDGYVVEGHVPAADIVRLLEERPELAGLAAPGMPASAPGMDMEGEPYDVLTFDGNGKTTLWASH